MRELREKPQLTIEEAIREALNKLTKFSGRSRRSEYWWCALAVFILNIVLGFIPLIGSIGSLFLALAMIPLTFRRLHDTGRSGWWWGVEAIFGICFTGGLIAYLVSVVLAGDIPTDDDMKLLKFLFMTFVNPYIIAGLLFMLVYRIVMLVFLCQDSQPEINKYGESPKYTIE